VSRATDEIVLHGADLAVAGRRPGRRAEPDALGEAVAASETILLRLPSRQPGAAS
jgi:hypothetical protein